MEDTALLVKRMMLSAIEKCKSCGRPFRPGNVHVVGQHDEFWFIAVRCSRCGSAMIIAALVDAGKIEIVSDMAGDEKSRLAWAPTIDVDDVINMHQFLKRFDGNFSQYFRSPGEETG